MQIFFDLNDVKNSVSSVVTLGTFDGLHLGHQRIIRKVVDRARLLGGTSLLITFEPHPRSVVSGGKEVKLLTTTDEKSAILENLGVQNLLVVNFTNEFSQLSPEKFINDYVVEGLKAKYIVIGYDHHFGRGRGGDAAALKELGAEYGFEVSIVEAMNVEGKTVSSSKIRSALAEGDLETANKMLGRFYSFGGTVISGDKRGRELGFPTANIKLDDGKKLLPALGIYLVEFLLDGIKHYGLLSIGKRPTFYDSGETVPEVYIYDFNSDIYGKKVTVNMVKRIRGEEKYSSADELIKQMNKDKEYGLHLIKEINS